MTPDKFDRDSRVPGGTKPVPEPMSTDLYQWGIVAVRRLRKSIFGVYFGAYIRGKQINSISVSGVTEHIEHDYEGLDMVDKAVVGGKKWISQKWLSNEAKYKQNKTQSYSKYFLSRTYVWRCC